MRYTCRYNMYNGLNLYVIDDTNQEFICHYYSRLTCNINLFCLEEFYPKIKFKSYVKNNIHLNKNMYNYLTFKLF